MADKPPRQRNIRKRRALDEEDAGGEEEDGGLSVEDTKLLQKARQRKTVRLRCIWGAVEPGERSGWWAAWRRPGGSVESAAGAAVRPAVLPHTCCCRA